MQINWYPGHMVKAKRLVQEHLTQVDVVVELLDARIPLSSRNPDIDQILGEKPRLILLNKADLADSSITKEWKDLFTQQGHSTVPISVTTGMGLNAIGTEVKHLAREALNKWVAKGRRPRAARLMVVGIPNVGKSSLINKLAGGKKAETGDRPGVTRQKQWVRLRQDMELLDMPGILWPRFDDPEVGKRLAATGAISDDVFDQEQLVKWLLPWLFEHYQDRLIARYKLSESVSQDPDELIEAVGRARGCLIAGGVIDLPRVAHLVLGELRAGKMGPISMERP